MPTTSFRGYTHIGIARSKDGTFLGARLASATNQNKSLAQQVAQYFEDAEQILIFDLEDATLFEPGSAWVEVQ